jgi:hypothetical protein
MASITIMLTVIGCIDYLAYGTISSCAMFRQKKYLMFFFAKKAQDEHWEMMRLKLEC